MKNLTLRQFRYFEALAEHGHFGRAAEASAISQPALSVQIKDMEETLGVPLFERDARQVRLTGFGETIASRVRGILQAVDELGDLARAEGRLAGRLRLGVIPTIAPYLLPTIISDLTAAYPGLDLHVRETLTSRLISGLRDGRLDAAILALPASEPWLFESPLFEEAFLLVRHEDEAARPPPEGEALQDMRLLLLEEGHCFRDQALAVCNLGASSPREGLDGSSLSTLVQMVGAGLGVTLIPEMAAPLETRGAAVTATRFGGPEPCRTVGMVWRKTSPLAPQLAEAAEIVRASAEAMRAAHAKI